MPSVTPTPLSAGEVVHSEVDVLIIGAGPAGVMAAEVLSRYTKYGLTCRIVDKRSAKLDNGQADGINSRSLEIFESLGFVERIEKEGSRMSEIGFWNPDPVTGRLTRTARIPDTTPGLSRFQQTILHQGRIESILADDMALHSSGQIQIERGLLPEDLAVDDSLVPDLAAHPISVTLRHLSESGSNPAGMTASADGTTKSGLFRSSLVTAEEEEALYKKNDQVDKVEVVKAKYVMGCDGAHSWTRRQLGIKMVGDATNFVWGVMDCVPRTNFPDIRSRCAVHSTNGSIMIIPQERDLVRLYIQLPAQLEPGQRYDNSKVTPEYILSIARKVLHPYTLETDQVDWFSAYHIGQRLTESFGTSRIFLAGDACHTHSPKAGQGMNTSMQDTFNWAWKVGHVLTKLAHPRLLDTYSAERQVVAQNLINFDKKFSKLFSGKPASAEDETNGVDLGSFREVFRKGNEFGAGMLVDYDGSVVVAKAGGTVESRQELASLLPVGKRFFSAQVVNVASATADQLTTRMPMDGSFRLLIFPGNVAEPGAMARLAKLAAYLDSASSIITKYTPKSRPRHSVIDVLTIHSSDRHALELYDFPQPSIFPAFDPHRAYKKIYCDGPSYHRGDGRAYEAYGISKEVGAVVVVRPDMHTALVAGLEDVEMLERYFGGFMLEAEGGGSPGSECGVVRHPVWESEEEGAGANGEAVEAPAALPV